MKCEPSAYTIDDLARDGGVARQLTSTGGAKSDAQFTPDSREVVYLEGGRVTAISVDRRESRPIAVTAEYLLDFDREKAELFTQADRGHPAPAEPTGSLRA